MPILSLDQHDEAKEIAFEVRTYRKLSAEQLIAMMKEKVRFLREQMKNHGNQPTHKIIQRTSG